MTKERNGSTHRWRELRARKIRQAIRQNGGRVACEKCGEILDPDARPGSAYAVEVDHVVPVALGGPEYPPLDRLRILCVRHNRGDGRAISEEKARRARQEATPRATAFGFVDESSRWNPQTRAW